MTQALWESARQDRPEWSNLLDQAAQIAPLEIPPETRQAILLGRHGGTSALHRSSTVWLFVSSTFTDTQVERNLLMTDVYPYLRLLCRRLGLTFDVVDLRWGIRNLATNNHETTEICQAEIRRCARNSLGPFFLGFLGDKLGYRPAPATLAQEVHGEITAHLAQQPYPTAAEDLQLFTTWYRLDENAVAPTYRLLPITELLPTWPGDPKASAEWWRVSRTLREVVEASADHMADQRGILTTADRVRFKVSVTEDEVLRGLFEESPGVISNAYIVRRFLEGISPEDPSYPQFVENAADRRLNSLDLSGRVPPERDLSFHVRWDPAGIRAQTHAPYLREFADSVAKSLTDDITRSAQKTLYRPDPVYDEQLDHLVRVARHAGSFVGREDGVSAVQAYLATAHADGPATPVNRYPFVVSGASGLGKTSLMCRVASLVEAQARDAGRPPPVLVARLLGTSGASSSAAGLLHNLATHLTEVYAPTTAAATPLPPVPTSYADLVGDFPKRLALATAERPLVLFLDSLDQLSDENNGRQLGWLPTTLPPHVHLVVSTLPEEGGCLARLRERLELDQRPDHLLTLRPLTPAECEGILDLWLAGEGLRLHGPQRARVVDAVTRVASPLFLRVTFDQARLWRSWTGAEALQVGADVPGAIALAFTHLEAVQGAKLVGRVLQLLTASREGLSSHELDELVSCDEDVLNDVFEWHVPPVRRLPPLLLVRIKMALQQSLTERSTDGGLTVLAWYHRQFWEAARRCYLATPEAAREAHSFLADYFLGTLAARFADRWISPQPLYFEGDAWTQGRRLPNLRRLRQAPYHLAEAGRWEDLAAFLTSLEVFLECCDDRSVSRFELLGYWLRIEASTSLKMTDAYLAMIKSYEDGGQLEPARLTELQHKTCEFLRSTGRFQHLEVVYEVALTRVVTLELTEEPWYASLLSSAGQYYVEVANFVKAQPLLEKAVSLFAPASQLPPNQMLGLASTLEKLGVFHFYKGMAGDRAGFERALPLFQRQLEIRQQVLGPDSAGVADARNNVAEALRNSGRVDEALEAHQAALRGRTLALGEGHLSTGDSWCNVGQVQRDRGDYDAALGNFRKAQAIHLAAAGPDNPRISDTEKHIGEVLVLQGQGEAAEPHLLNALRIREMVNPDHYDVGAICRSISSLYVSLGRHEEAAPYLARSEAIAAKTQTS